MLRRLFHRKRRHTVRTDRSDLSAIALINKQIRMQKYGA